MRLNRDGKNQLFIAWAQGKHGFKRAWIQHRSGYRDWARTGRYINVVRTQGLGSPPRGNSTDFPIFTDLPDDQALIAFVVSVCGATGCKLPR